jgi:prepilin-type N-terminal cleavage/methylation domain-containing protein
VEDYIMKLNQKGFSVIEITIVIAVIGVIGSVGWLVYDHQKSKNTDDNTIVSPTQVNNTTENTANSNETISAKYLVVSEWGVKIKLTDDITKATYVFEKPDNQWAYLNTPRLVELSKQYPECSSAKDSISFNRAKPGDDRFGSPWTENMLKEIGIKVGDYYYFAEGGQPCFSDKQDFQTPKEISSIRASLSNAIKTVEQQ